MRAAVYTRISSDRAGAGLGVHRQQQDCEALVAERGWETAAVYSDNDTSAYSGKRRTGYEAMLADVEAGAVDAIVAWHPDRLQRSPVELERFIDIVERHGVQVATVQGGEYDLSTAAGRMTARVVGAVARHESEHKSERLRRKHLELAEAGRSSGGGHRPYGYSCFGNPDTCDVAGCPHDGAMSVIEAEAKVIRDAARQVAAGVAPRGVVAAMNANGTRTTRGNEWSPHSFNRMITSPRIAGLRQYHGRRLTLEQRRAGEDVVGAATWPAIVDRATWETVRRIILDPDRRVSRSARRYLLTGMLRCGLCDARLVARPRGDKRRCYVCAKGPGFSGCGKLRSLADPLEALVVEAVLQSIDSPAFAEGQRRRHESDAADDAVSGELTAVDQQLDQADMDHADGVIDRRAWLNMRQRLTQRRDALNARLATTARSNTLSLVGDSPRESWPNLSFDERRAVLAAVLERVTLQPAVKGRNFFDPNRVTLAFKA